MDTKKKSTIIKAPKKQVLKKEKVETLALKEKVLTAEGWKRRRKKGEL